MSKVKTVKRLSTNNFRKDFKSFKQTPYSVFSGDARNMLKYLDEKFFHPRKIFKSKTTLKNMSKIDIKHFSAIKSHGGKGRVTATAPELLFAPREPAGR